MSKTNSSNGTMDPSDNIFIKKNGTPRMTEGRVSSNVTSERNSNVSSRVNSSYSGKDIRRRIGNEPARSSIDFGIDMFPELTISTSTSTSTSTSNTSSMAQIPRSTSWLDTIKQREEDEKNSTVGINVNDKQYWNGVQWIGPMFMRARKPEPTIMATTDPNNPNNPSTSKSDDLILQPYPQVFDTPYPVKNIEYSRDNLNWYDSWDETFSEQQLEYMRLDEERKEQFESFKTMEDYRRRVEYESIKYYNEVGELSEYAKAVFNREEYEKYANQLDRQYYDNDNEEYTDMLEDYEYLEEEEDDDDY